MSSFPGKKMFAVCVLHDRITKLLVLRFVCFDYMSHACLLIISDLGYGKRGAGRSIPPNATLYFTIELVGISNKR